MCVCVCVCGVCVCVCVCVSYCLCRYIFVVVICTGTISVLVRATERPTVDKHQTVLVFFIGGCTFAEIAALRFLSQREDGKKRGKIFILFTVV